jgi:hypothetical protein
MNLETLKTEIRQLIVSFVVEVRAAIAVGQLDISSASETFLEELFREVFDLPSLKNLNSERANFPGLDLGDDDKGVAFQITADPRLAKVLETLTTVLAENLQVRFPTVHIYITTEKQNSYSQEAIQRTVTDKLVFDGKRHILDYRDILSRIRGFPLEKLERIAALLRKHLGLAENRPPDPAVVEGLERDFSLRYRRAMQRAVFPENGGEDLFRGLAEEILGCQIRLSSSLRRRILLRATRNAALRRRVEDGKRYLAVASSLEGPDSDLPARALLAETEQDADTAMRLLRDENDSDSRSVLLAILARVRGDNPALDWLAEHRLSPSGLNYVGVIALSQILLRQHRVSDLCKALDEITEASIADCPYLLFLRGAARLSSIFPAQSQGIVFLGIPLAVRSLQPAVTPQELAKHLDGTIADFERLLPIARDLELPQALQIAEACLIWARLLDPMRRDRALSQLKSVTDDPTRVLPVVQFLLAFDPEFDPSPIAEWLKRREAFGGLSEDELRAALILQLHGDEPIRLSELIAKYRPRYQKLLGEALTLSIEVQALAQAKDSTSARMRLQEGRSMLDGPAVAMLETEITKAEGADPVKEHLRLYETTRTADALRALVDALHRKGDHLALGKYAEILFAETGDRRDLGLAAHAYARARDFPDFVRIVESHDFLLDDLEIKRAYGWQQWQLGKLKEATLVCNELRESGRAHRDLNLEIAIAIDSGNWEMLAAPLATYLTEAGGHDAATLLRAANLAQVSGYGSFEELLNAAVAKGPDDPQVLVGAYTVAVEGGLEDRRQDVHDWFRKALDASGEGGPVQRFELKELLNRQLEWREQSRKINEAIVQGDMPLVVAALALRTTIVELVLGNLTRNVSLNDARKRTAIPLFSGRRVPARLHEAKRIALDITAVMVLGWLGMLPKVLGTFAEVLLPGGLLFDLFEGHRRLRQFQRSRLARAQQVLEVIRNGLRIVPTSVGPADPLAKEVGIDLAGLLHLAEADGGVVIRPAPVLRLGLDARTPADMSRFAPRLADMYALLRALRSMGAIDQATDEAAERYFRMQDTGWPSSPSILRQTPLYLDDLAVSYLQTTQLLPTVVQAFDAVYVHTSVQEEAASLLELDKHNDELSRTVNNIREAIRRGFQIGTVTFGPRRPDGDADVGFESSTLHLLADLHAVDFAVIDDRSLNKELYASDQEGNRVNVSTTLDVIEDLAARGILSEPDRRVARHRLRSAGATLVAVDAAEIVSALQRSGDEESAEFRGIRDSANFVRAKKIARFPAEAAWFSSFMNATKTAIMDIWKQEPDTDRAAGLADMVLDLRPNISDWEPCWEGNAPPNWTEAMSRIFTASLALPLEITDAASLSAYAAWLDERVLRDLRATAPERYTGIVEYIRSLVIVVGETRGD